MEQKSIYLATERRLCAAFEDFYDALTDHFPGMEFLKFEDPSTLALDKDIFYIFCFNIPNCILLYIQHNQHYLKNVYFLNTEQLTQHMWLSYANYIASFGITCLHYSKAHCALMKDKPCIYFPSPYSTRITQHLNSFMRTIPKQYDVAFCALTTAPRRNHVYQQLLEMHISVLDVTGWKDERDMKIASAKILINIHFADDYRIFEHFRCDRWATAGMLIVAEDSIGDENMDIKDLIIIAKYDQLAATVKKVLDNYDYYTNEAQQKAEKHADKLKDITHQSISNLIKLINS